MNTAGWERQRAAMARASAPRALRTVPPRVSWWQRFKAWLDRIDLPENTEGDL